MLVSNNRDLRKLTAKIENIFLGEFYNLILK